MGTIDSIDIQQEVRSSYLDYAMSVIVARALPDLRDGLKPVQRRILYGMWRLNLKHNTKFAKAARIVGSIMGYYHPHGDAPIYEALVRMAQDFSLRYPLIVGQGNFGCFTGDTKVQLVDGCALSFRELVKEARQGKKHYTYTYNFNTKRIEIAQIQTPRKTKQNAQLMRVTLDNGEEIRCTPDHRFMLRDGSYRQAKDLQPQDSLMPLYLRLSTKEDDPHVVEYEMVRQPLSSLWEYTHRLSDVWNIAHGIYDTSAGKIRHHVDFNKRNNNPDNIRRLVWEAHWRAHYEFTSTRHRIDAEYRRKLAEGRKAYYALPETKEKIAKRMAQWNKEMWQDPKYRLKKIREIMLMWENPGHKERMASLASQRLIRKWQQTEFRESVSAKKSQEMKEKWQDLKYRRFWHIKTQEISRKIWENPNHRKLISGLMKLRWQDEEYRSARSLWAKALWKDPSYRAKFPREHFVNAAKKLWQGSAWRASHTQRIKNLWNDHAFREKIIARTSEASRKRIERDPEYMSRLSEKAKAALHLKWQNPEYKAQVVRSKILGFVSKLSSKHQLVTPTLYEKERTHNGVPSIKRALTYFSNFKAIIEDAKLHNHKVLKVEFLPQKEDVYDLTIEESHNFALAAGVFVHNSIDGDPPAQQRYTEAKLSRIAEELLEEIDKETVTWKDTFDGTKKEPEFLPAKLPQLLLNGAQGIAVGMTTNMPPHNLSELVDALIYLLAHPNASLEKLLEFIKGPDFPTAGTIYDQEAIRIAYTTGRGAIPMRAKAQIKEQKSGKFIVVSELPYQVNKSDLITEIADLVRAGKIEGIQDVIDGSRKDDINIVIELKRAGQPQKVLNQLYHHTRLQKNFNVLMIALVDGIEPRVLSLPEMLRAHIAHRQLIIRKRTEFELRQAKERAHILEGLVLALAHIDEVIAVIKKSPSKEQAGLNLQQQFALSELQAQAILQMRLQTLAALEREAIARELAERKALIAQLEAILASQEKINSLIKEELAQAKKQFGGERKTQVLAEALGQFSATDLIPQERALILLTRNGYLKRFSPKALQAQGRGGVGVTGITLGDNDQMFKSLSCWTHDDLLFFSGDGKLFRMKVYDIPEKSRTAKGDGLYEFIEPAAPICEMSILPAKESERAGAFLVIMSKKGLTKKVALNAFARIPKKGIKVMNVGQGDACLTAMVAGAQSQLLGLTAKGQALRFSLAEIRPMGRQAAGVRGMRVKEGDELVQLIHINKPDDRIVLITEKGYGKTIKASSFSLHHRGTSGMKALTVAPRTGNLKVVLRIPEETQNLYINSTQGKTIKINVSGLPLLGRTAQGVRLIRLKEGDKVASGILL